MRSRPPACRSRRGCRSPCCSSVSQPESSAPARRRRGRFRAARLEFDTPISRQFPVYTRANAGEVLPGILSPLGWTLIGPPAEKGFRISLCRHCGAFTWPRDDSLFVGRLGGRFVLNLAALRTVAERLPGTSAAAVDGQYFGDASRLGLPAHEPRRSDRLWYGRSVPAVVRTMASLSRWARDQRGAVETELDATRRLLAAGPSDVEIVARLRSLQPVFADAFATHVTARALSSPAVELLRRAVAGAGGSPDLALRLLAGLTDLESSQPSRDLSRLAATVDADGPLASVLATGTTLADLEASPLADAAALAAKLRGFVARYGHRGMSEWNPALPAWEQEPDSVVALLAAVVAGGRAPDSGETRAAAVGELSGLVRGARRAAVLALAKNAQQALLRGEKTKATGTLASHAMRLLVEELRQRWSDRIAPADLNLLSLAEVEDIAAGGDVPGAVVERRRRELEAAAEVEVPEIIVDELRVDERRPAGRAGGTVALEGIAGSAGTAVGRARVLTEPTADFDDGDVLVVSVTDTAWTPLFLAASAVVTDVGGVLSHATIVARDLGIPAVVNTKTATRDIASGDTVEVDGSTGIVRVVQRAGASSP